MGFTYTAKNSILNAMTGRSQYASLAATCMIGVGVMEGDVFTEPDTTTGYSRTLLGNYQSADSKCMGEPVQGNIRNTKIIYLPEAVADWGTVKKKGSNRLGLNKLYARNNVLFTDYDEDAEDDSQQFLEDFGEDYPSD